MLPYVQAVTAMGYAEAQKYTFANCFVLAFSTVLHVILICIFVTWLEMGWQGVCLATSIQFAMRFLIAIIYLNFVCEPFKESSSVKLFSRGTMQSLMPQLQRGLMSMMMFGWSWWAFDIFTLIASYLSAEIVSAQTIMRSLGLLTFMIPVGFSKACAYFVGFFIGQGSEEAIRHYYKIATGISAICGVLQIIILWIIRDYVIKMYTNQVGVQD